MNKIFFKYLFVVFLLCNLSCFSQNKETRIDSDFPTKDAFPNQYFGEYSGNIRIADGTGVIANIPMEFSFQPTNQEGVYKYELIYIRKKTREVQKYTLTTVNKEKGAYYILGEDGIKFPTSKIDDTFYGTFVMNENVMTTELEFNKNGKVYFTVNKSTRVKLNEESNKNNEPEYAYYMVLLQEAFFVKNAID